MSEQIPSTNCAVAPSQVWVHLTADLKMKVIWLLSQLAFNVVTTQTDRMRKEADDVTI